MPKLDREDVLDAIRQWVADNGRVPGRRAFVAAHGDLPRTVFDGMVWPSWSAAVREAGFDPMAPTSRIDDSDLLTACANLTRELGHSPSVAEWRFKRKQDPSFPSQSVVQRRFGDTDDRIERIREWCKANDDYADVLALLPAPVEAKPAAGEQRDGSVYLLRSNRLYKIGMTYSVPRRWAEIAGAAPDEVDLVHHFKTDDPAGIEAYWHRRFGPSRRGGEWFELKPSDVAAFKRRKGFM